MDPSELNDPLGDLFLLLEVLLLPSSLTIRSPEFICLWIFIKLYSMVALSWFCSSRALTNLSLSSLWLCISTLRFLLVAEKYGGVYWNLFPLDFVSAFPIQTFSPIVYSSYSLGFCASSHMLVLMAQPNQLYRTALSGMLPCDYSSAKCVNNKLLDNFKIETTYPLPMAVFFVMHLTIFWNHLPIALLTVQIGPFRP